MSVSAHLTPEPERRLWLILESMRNAVDAADARIAGLTLLSVLELAFIHVMVPTTLPGRMALATLTLSLPLGVLAFAPVKRMPPWLSFLEPHRGKPKIEDSLITAEDLSKYSHGDLIFRLDKYLGGGITATPYYEDVVVQIVENARLAERKQRHLRTLCLVVAAGQLGLLGQLIGR